MNTRLHTEHCIVEGGDMLQHCKNFGEGYIIIIRPEFTVPAKYVKTNLPCPSSLSKAVNINTEDVRDRKNSPQKNRLKTKECIFRVFLTGNRMSKRLFFFNYSVLRCTDWTVTSSHREGCSQTLQTFSHDALVSKH